MCVCVYVCVCVCVKEYEETIRITHKFPMFLVTKQVVVRYQLTGQGRDADARL